MYRAQLLRVGSLLLRAARRGGYLMPAPPESQDISETTFILHPEHAGELGWLRVHACGPRA